MEGTAEALVGIVAIICTIGFPVFLGLIASYMSIKSRHEERMALIEKGINPVESRRREKTPNSYPALRNGMFMVGIAVGTLVGLFLLPYIPDESDWSILTVPILAILFGGIAFILYFFISRKMYAAEQQRDRASEW